MALQEIAFTSHNGRDHIQAWIYEPAADPVAVVQLVHGLGEHSRRYLHMITTLLDARCIVVADDHAGHGRTAMLSGVWTDAGDDGAKVVVEDELTLQGLVREQFPDLPYLVFGHSWGSMIARAMAVDPRARLNGLALCGVAAQLKGLEHSLDREGLRAAVDADPAGRAEPVFVEQMFDGFLDRCGPNPGPTDWVATDPFIVRDHAKDKFNNFGAPMSNRFAWSFLEIYQRANSESFYRDLPPMPVLIFSGGDDPVANFGDGAQQVADELSRAGHDVEIRIYPGLRHEVHNESKSRADVEAKLVRFVTRVASAT